MCSSGFGPYTTHFAWIVEACFFVPMTVGISSCSSSFSFCSSAFFGLICRIEMCKLKQGMWQVSATNSPIYSPLPVTSFGSSRSFPYLFVVVVAAVFCLLMFSTLAGVWTCFLYLPIRNVLYVLRTCWVNSVWELSHSPPLSLSPSLSVSVVFANLCRSKQVSTLQLSLDKIIVPSRKFIHFPWTSFP